MPTVQFLASSDSTSALRLPRVTLSDDQTSPEGLRAAFRQGTGRPAFVLHDGGLGLGVAGENYLVRMESDVPGTPQEAHTPLENARAWQRPGWFAQTLDWLNNVLGEPVIKTEQVSTNDLACVLRVVTEQRTVYLKASETGLEVTLTAQLAAQQPDLIPVVAWDEQRCVLVTRDCGLRLSETAELALWNKAVTKLAHLQRRADAATLLKSGCPVYDFAALADQAEGFLHATDTLRSWGLTGAQISRLLKQLPRIRDAHNRVTALNLPLLPAHGDAHPMNALTGGGVVWFDLSEACTAHPLLDIGWFLAWLSHPARHTLPLRQTCPDAAAVLWSDYLKVIRIPEAEPLLLGVMALALTHRALVYHERFEKWEGTVPGWRPQHVPYCLRLLLKLL